MSVNQSRGEKNEPPQYRRSGRSGNPASQRNFSGGIGGAKGGGGGGSTTAPPSSSFNSGKSFKKVVSNAPGAQTRVSGPNPNVNFGSSNSSVVGRAIENGAHVQQPLRGTPDASLTGSTVKPTDVSVQKSSPGLPKAPQSNVIPPSSGTTGPSTPAKGSADASRAFSLQFGSISPGVMNGMQVPARTSSAPPNLDEQKRAQARLDSLKATPFQNLAIPKHVPRKNAGAVDQSNAGDTHPTAKERKEVPPSAAPVAATVLKPSGPPMPSIPGVSMQMQFHQPQLHLQFGGPNPPLQSQAMANTSMPLPISMHLPVGNPPQVPTQVFVPGIQHHPMSSQGIIHPNQALNFATPQLGNMGIGLGPQYQQQQLGNYGGSRRTVKITHPDTHEELRLDKRTDGYPNVGPSGPRSHPQSQPIPSYPPMNYYPNSYNATPIFFQPPGSNPLTSAQTNPGSQAPRFYNQPPSKQVTVKPAVSTHIEKVSDSSSAGSTPAMDKNEIPKTQKAGGEATHPRKDFEPVIGSSLPQLSATAITISSKPSASLASTEDNIVAEGEEKTVVNRASSFKEDDKQPAKKIHTDKISGQSSSVTSSSVGDHGSIDGEIGETSKILIPSETEKDVLETNKLAPSTVDADGKECDNNKKDPISIGVIDSGSSSKAEKSVDENHNHDAPDATMAVDTGSQGDGPTNNNDGKSLVTTELDVLSAQTSSLNLGTSHGEKISNVDDRSSSFDGEDTDHVNSKESSTPDEESHTVSVSVPETSSLILDVENTSSGSIDKSLLDASKGKANTPKGKKKIKEILRNADARGTTDLYNAYKRPEEKKESLSADIIESPKPSIDFSEKDVTADKKHGQTKSEPDDWEDAADISTPKLETSDDRNQACAGLKHHSEDDNDGMTKKYSRDFLLKFSEDYTDLPEGFEITTDIVEALIESSSNSYREPYPSPGRGGGPRLDRRQSNVGEDDKWSRGPGSMGPGRDMRLDMGYLGNPVPQGFRGGNHGGLRTPRPQTPGQYAGGILSGPIPSPGLPGSMQRNNSDSDRWQRATNYQKGLMPSPQTLMPKIHKAEKKYEVGKVTDEEQAKQRQLKGILNKLTPQNFEKLFEQVKEVNIDNSSTLSGVISQIFDKALMEPTFVEMYANFCSQLAGELPDFSEGNEKITFKRLLLNKCQEEFERGEREEEEANRNEDEGELKQSEEEMEEKRVKARRRMLGNIRFIGELYKKKMLTEKIMHACINKLLGQSESPDEEDIESLCKLMTTIGEMIDHSKAKDHIDSYFKTMFILSNNMKISSRVRFMLKDVIDLRKNKWQQRRKVEGPKKIEEVHRDAAQERQAQSSRLARGPNPNPSLRRGQPMDFGPKGSNALPSNVQMGGYRGLPQNLRGFGNQDSRFDERPSFENRPLTVPLRPVSDDSITLGPQGGLARGMSVRGQPSMHEMSNPADSRRGMGGPNGYGSMPDRGGGYGPRDELASRYIPERVMPRPSYDQSNIQDHDVNYMNRDARNPMRISDRVPPPSSPPSRGWVPPPPQTGSSDKVFDEDRLHDMSLEAIKEFYSARDEKEVALCIKDLNSPSFYPSMVSIWVTDSFERKAMDREALAKLLINLTRSQDGMLNQDSLVRGFESVLSALEDTVNDAPKAAEFLGGIFARILLENVIPYKEVWRLIYEGGEEQGRLVETGLAAEVLGVILEIIQSEKGGPFLNDMRAGSNLGLESFRPPSTVKKPSRLDKFI